MLPSRIAHYSGIPAENGEQMQILRYENGQEYRPHPDYFDETSEEVKKTHLQGGGQRVATMLMYLTDVEKGGRTIFPSAERRPSGTTGQCSRGAFAWGVGERHRESGGLRLEMGSMLDAFRRALIAFRCT